jgi:Xaa-Pro aminopeptidase
VNKHAPAPGSSRIQRFAEVGGPAKGAERVAALRAELAKKKFTGYLVPRADEHQNEYVAPGSERLLWLTGFSGSAGLAIVLTDRAAVFVDGRYTTQAAEQLDPSVFSVEPIVEAPPSLWLEKNLQAGDKIGFDPWLHTADTIQRLSKICEKAGAKLTAVDRNPIDAIWKDRPAAPSAPISIQPLEYTGLAAQDKIAAVQQKLGRVDGLVLSDAHNVAWLLNIRGGDVSHTPLPLVFAYLPKDGRPTLFVDPAKLGKEARAHIEAVADVQAPGALSKFIAALGKAKARVVIDNATGPQALVSKLETAGGKALVEADPITLTKAKKTEAELNGSLAAHLRDGAAMARFLSWFDEAAPKGKVTEVSAAEKLEDFRRETGVLKDLSFPSISAAGPHAAIPHYRVSDTSNLKVGKGLYLIDSGGQYQDGTTDITRTIAVGKPSALMRDRFTRVLKGHIAVARAVFPKGTTGVQIDALAREPLWRAGLDFDHGTGHGIGSYLSVHEGPQRIAKSGNVPLEPGMIISNEPGYYLPGEFGIRIENLVVVEAKAIRGGEREMLGFQTISFVPIDLNAIDADLLDAEEIEWLNGYHAEVREKLSPLLDRETRAWLKKATRKI